MADFKPKERVKTALDNRKLNLSTPVPDVQGKTSSMIWGMYANNPRITVFTNFPEDTGESKGYGKINANMGIMEAMMLFQMIKKYAQPETAVDTKEKIENLNFTWFGGKRSDKPALISTTWVGKDKDGIVWISVVCPASQGRPVIKFKLLNPEFSNYVYGDGTPVPATECSRRFALAYADVLETMIKHMSVSDWVAPPPPEPRPGFGGNRGSNSGGGGYNNRSGGGGSKEMDMGDDIPF
jgi:hypothetical protein